MTEADILVVGGGPAGLLAASQLAPRHRVALIERGYLAKTTKYWATTERRLRTHNLTDCVLTRPPGMFVGTFLGGRVLIPGDMVVVDEHKILRELVTRCKQRGVVLRECSTLVNMAWTPAGIIAETTTGPYRSRLVIDASGVHSPIAQTFRLHRLHGFYSVYGAHIENIRLRTSDMVLAYVNSLGTPPPMLEVFPTGAESAYCAVFVYSKTLIKPNSLDSIFKSECARNPFFKLTDHSKLSRGKAGAIAIGNMARRNLSGLLSFGEAGMSQPPLLGSAFNEILQHCDDFCTHVTDVLAETAGVPRKANYRYPWSKRTQDRLQLALARTLLDGNVETFDRVVRFMSKLAPGDVYDFCSNEATWRHLARAILSLPLCFKTTGPEFKLKSDS